jgi:hypothetical protein
MTRRQPSTTEIYVGGGVAALFILAAMIVGLSITGNAEVITTALGQIANVALNVITWYRVAQVKQDTSEIRNDVNGINGRR